MKKTLLFCILLLFCLWARGQQSVKDFVDAGIVYHDEGQYDKALAEYEKALKIDPKSTDVLYEMAMTVSAIGDYKKAIKYCDQVIKLDKNFWLAYNTKGSCQDNLGLNNQAIKTFTKGIEVAPDKYLLYFNLGYAYCLRKDYPAAAASYQQALKLNPNHASSHLHLGSMMQTMNQKVPALLSYYYFLMLEPASKRSVTAYDALKALLDENVKVDDFNSATNIKLFFDSKSGDEFAAIELLLAMRIAQEKLNKGKDMNDPELFESISQTLFSSVKVKSGMNDIICQLYIPFFSAITNEGLADIFCRYISISTEEEAQEWIDAHPERADALVKFLFSDEE